MTGSEERLFHVLKPCPICGRAPMMIHTMYQVTIRCKGDEHNKQSRHLVEATSIWEESAVHEWNERTGS